MPSSPKEFRALSRKEITLPSGLTVEIRKLSAMDFVGHGEIPLPSSGDDSAEKKPNFTGEQIVRFAGLMLTKGSMSPHFSEKAEDLDNPDVVHISDLSNQDLTFAAAAIAEFSGFSKEAAAEAESFRKDKESPAGT